MLKNKITKDLQEVYLVVRVRLRVPFYIRVAREIDRNVLV